MYQLECVQQIPLPLEKAWDFFSSPKNLQLITPEHMGFNITSAVPERMYEGLFISYRVSPFKGVRLNWVTEITHIRPLEFFVDEQRVGPYAVWHHEHHFREINGGVEMFDRVSYLLPYGPVGRLLSPVIGRKVKDIFDYRYRKVETLFGSMAK